MSTPTSTQVRADTIAGALLGVLAALGIAAVLHRRSTR